MKDVLLFNAGSQLFIIDGSRRTDSAARAVISALWAAGRITIDIADRAKEDRPTLDKIKKSLTHCTMETNGKRWKFYTKSGLYMDIPAYCANHITADANGRLYLAEATTSEGTTEPAQDTTTTETEQKNGKETAKTTDMETFARAYYAAYTALYDHCGEQETDERERYYCILFDESWEEIKDIVKEFSAYRGDLMTSDRACAAFMLALEAVGTPTTPQNAPQGVESTTSDQTPTDGHKTPYGATDEATTGGKTITDGTTDGATPASDPRQPDGATAGGNTPNGNEITGGNTITGSRTDGGKAITTDGGNRITSGKNITPPRTACENATQGAESLQGIETPTPRHKTPPRGKYKAAHDRPPALRKICARTRVPSGALYFTGAG